MSTPRDAAAVRADLEALAKRRRVLAEQATALEAKRTALLAQDASAAEIRKLRNQREDLEVEAEKIEFRESALKAELAAVIDAASIAQARAVLAAAEAAIACWNAWVSERYPGLASAIAAGLELERAANAARAEVKRTPLVAGEGLPTINTGFVGKQAVGMARMVRLPGIQPGEPFAWVVERE